MCSIYIHIPFCIRKCNYCGFTSFDNLSRDIVSNYVKLLVKEIELISGINDSLKKIKTIFFGGGTPSLLTIKHFQIIFNSIKKYFDISELEEITLEINPVTEINFQELKEIGFNRISIGIQSFNDKELIILGRLHNAKLAEKTITEAQKFFQNISIDLIYGIPNQIFTSFQKTIEKALSFGIQHISAYNLIIENETKLHKMISQKTIEKATEDQETEMYNYLCETLEKNNFSQYEVSNFARSGYECKHNINYWERGNYFGLGVAAHSMFNNNRWANTEDFSQYEKKISSNQLPIISKEILTSKQILEEILFLGLRSNGVDIDILNEKQKMFLKDCINNGFAKKIKDRIILTSNGKFLTDFIVFKIL